MSDQNNTTTEEIEQKLIKLEAKILEQEHRPFRILWNFFTRKNYDKNDPRRLAVYKSVFFRFFTSPTTLAGGGIIGILTLIFMFQQNMLFKDQNELLKYQNKQINDQKHIDEATRRTSQTSASMDEVLADVNRELTDPRNTEGVLSNTLTGRIISLSRSMKPYRYLEGDSLIPNPISPERGQLLIALVKSKIDSTFFVDKILKSSDFSYADLSGADLIDANLGGVKLEYANLKNAKLYNANLSNSYLVNANLTNTRLFNADMRSSNLRNANLTRTFLVNVKLQGAYLNDALLNKTNLKDADLTGANMTNAILKETNLSNANLSTSLAKLYLEKVDLSMARLENADLTDAFLDSVFVGRYNWLSYISDELKVTGSKKIKTLYRVDSISDPGFGTSYLIIKKQDK